MISAWWLLLLFPAVWFGYILCALLSGNSDSTEKHYEYDPVDDYFDFTGPR